MQRRVRQHLAVAAAPEDRGEVEAEAVHVHLGHPVAQRRQDLEAHHRVVAVERVAAAGVVEVLPGLRLEQVVGRVVEPAPAEGGAALVALAGVVEDDVEDHLDARLVERLHHRLELAHGVARARLGRVGGLGREERDRLVAPEVPERLPGQQVRARVVALLELGHRHQLDRGHAQLLQVGDLLDQPAEGAGVRDAGARVAGEAADVQLVDDRVGERHGERVLVAPVELLVHRPGSAAARGGPWLPPPRPTSRGPRPTSSRGRSGPCAGRSAALVEPGGTSLSARKPYSIPGSRPHTKHVPDVARLVVARVERQLEHGLGSPGTNSTRLTAVACFEKTEKFTPSRRAVAP